MDVDIVQECLINTPFLQNRGFYEFAFLRDGPYFFKVNAP